MDRGGEGGFLFGISMRAIQEEFLVDPCQENKIGF